MDLRSAYDEYGVSPVPVSREVIEELKKAIDSGRERPASAVIKSHRELLVQEYADSEMIWIFPEHRFGAEYQGDFIILRGDPQKQARYTLVELESSSDNVVEETQKGSKRARLGRKVIAAIEQLEGWRAWIGSNRDYAERECEGKRVPLKGINCRAQGLVIVGREETRTRFPGYMETLAQWEQDLNIEIWTYDRLVTKAEGRLRAAELNKSMVENEVPGATESVFAGARALNDWARRTSTEQLFITTPPTDAVPIIPPSTDAFPVYSMTVRDHWPASSGEALAPRVGKSGELGVALDSVVALLQQKGMLKACERMAVVRTTLEQIEFDPGQAVVAAQAASEELVGGRAKLENVLGRLIREDDVRTRLMKLIWGGAEVATTETARGAIAALCTLALSILKHRQ